MGSNHEKNGGQKSRDTLPLSYKFTIHRLNLVKISLGDILILYFFLNILFLKRNNFLKIFFLYLFLKIDFITLDTDQDPDLDPVPAPDPNWVKILDPDPNSMYLDPQHWLCELQAVQIGGQTCTAHDSIAVGFECD